MKISIRRGAWLKAAGLAWLGAIVPAFIVSCGSPESPDLPVPPACISRAVFGDPAQSPYVLPYPVGSAYRVLQSYCNSRGSHSNQLAYDFQMAIGSPVVAAREGLVVQVVDLYLDSDRDQSHFNYILIQHADGTVAFYAHLQLHSLTVRQNDRVEKGHPLASSGSCGTPIADLHFGVYESFPPREGHDLPVNFINAQGPLDARGGLQSDISYLATSY